MSQLRLLFSYRRFWLSYISIALLYLINGVGQAIVPYIAGLVMDSVAKALLFYRLCFICCSLLLCYGLIQLLLRYLTKETARQFTMALRSDLFSGFFASSTDAQTATFLLERGASSVFPFVQYQLVMPCCSMFTLLCTCILLCRVSLRISIGTVCYFIAAVLLYYLVQNKWHEKHRSYGKAYTKEFMEGQYDLLSHGDDIRTLRGGRFVLHRLIKKWRHFRTKERKVYLFGSCVQLLNSSVVVLFLLLTAWLFCRGQLTLGISLFMAYEAAFVLPTLKWAFLKTGWWKRNTENCKAMEQLRKGGEAL